MSGNAPSGPGPELETSEAAEAWGSMTLSRFLRHLPPGITVVHDAGDRPLRWVEPSDIEDPTDYLLPHELILTSGFPLVGRSEDREFVRSFIGRLVGAQVSAVGFGMAPYFEAIPSTVIDACRDMDLTLWQIPAELPFAAVGMGFAKLMEIDGARMHRENADANRQLMKCVAGQQPEQDIVTVLASRSRSAVQLFGAAGRLRYRSAGPGARTLEGPELASLLAEAAGAGGSKLTLHEAEGWYHLAFPIRASTSPRAQQAPLLGTLQVSFPRNPGASEHSVMATAFGLLEVVARQRNLGSLAAPQLATALLLGQVDVTEGKVFELFNASLGGGAHQAPRVVVAAPRQDVAELDPGHELTRLRSLLDSKLVLHSHGRFTAITRSEPTSQLFSRMQEAGYLAAFSQPADDSARAGGVPAAALGGLLREQAAEALALLPRVLEEGRSLSADDLPLTFASLLPPHASRHLAEKTLAALLDLPQPRRDLYLRVLRAWLEMHGSWDATAHRIDMHRNSVRRHIGSIGELLDMDLTRADHRAELFLSLKVLGNPADA